MNGWRGIAGAFLGAILSTQAVAADPPLARYFPRERLAVYLEYDGIINHQAAYDKSAMAQVLGPAGLGRVIEEIVRQVADYGLTSEAGRRLNLTGADVATLMKVVAGSGFAVGFWTEPDRQPGGAAFVARGVGRGEVRTIVDLLLKLVPKSSGATPWFEGDDLVVLMGPPMPGEVANRRPARSPVTAALEGVVPNAIDHPRRLELLKGPGGLETFLLGFVDVGPLPKMPPEAVALGLDGVTGLDLRASFAAEALLAELRLDAPAPRRGLLRLLDQPTFTLKDLPPIPKDIADFTAVSLDPGRIIDVLTESVNAVNPGAKDAFDQIRAQIKDQTGIDYREDILDQFGPIMAGYIAADSSDDGLGLFFLSIPKVTGVARVKDPEKFAATLDRLVAAINPALEQLGTPIATRGGMIDLPADLPKRPGTLHAEFRKLKEGRGYALTIPPAVLPTPSGLRPTILLGKEHVVFAMNPDAARAALAPESDRSLRWEADAENASWLKGVPEKLIMLNVSDTRATAPEFLANLPMFTQLIGLASLAQPPGGGAVRPFVLQFDPETLPSVAALREPLFPQVIFQTVDDQGLSYRSRSALPFPSTPSGGSSAYWTLMMASAASNLAVFSTRRSFGVIEAVLEGPEKVEATNQLKQIGLAFHNFHDTNGQFPAPAITDKDGKPLLSWRVAVLPYLEQQPLYEEFHLDEPWDSPHNLKLVEKIPPPYKPTKPAEGVKPGETYWQVVVGKTALFEKKDQAVSIADIVDGTSNTFLVVEAGKPVPWTKPDDIAFDPGDKDAPAPSLGGMKLDGGFLALFCDGSVRLIKTGVMEQVLRALMTPAGGEVISADSF